MTATVMGVRMDGQSTSASRRDTPATPALLIRLLGGFTISVGERPIPDDVWRGQKVRALLKLLALAPAQRLARDQLLDTLWPDFTPDAAASNLYSTLTVVRKALAGVATLRLRAGMVALHAPDGVRIDVADFLLAAARARDSPDPADYRRRSPGMAANCCPMIATRIGPPPRARRCAASTAACSAPWRPSTRSGACTVPRSTPWLASSRTRRPTRRPTWR